MMLVIKKKHYDHHQKTDTDRKFIDKIVKEIERKCVSENKI